MAETTRGTKRTAFVTGASYGIGAASALALARDGCDVAVSDLRSDDLADTVKAITTAGARGVPLTRAAADVTEAEWDEVIGVNLKGAFFVTQQMGRHLIAAGRPGAIMSI